MAPTSDRQVAITASAIDVLFGQHAAAHEPRARQDDY
jgi:hypothetical protein